MAQISHRLLTSPLITIVTFTQPVTTPFHHHQLLYTQLTQVNKDCRTFGSIIRLLTLLLDSKQSVACLRLWRNSNDVRAQLKMQSIVWFTELSINRGRGLDCCRQAVSTRGESAVQVKFSLPVLFLSKVPEVLRYALLTKLKVLRKCCRS